MPVQALTPILNVSNIAESFAWFELLGWHRGFSWNQGGRIGSGLNAAATNEHGEASFGSVCSGDATIFLCRNGQGSRGTYLPPAAGGIPTDATDGVWMSWWMDAPADVDGLYALAREKAMTVTYPPTNEPWGVREFHLRHPDCHVFRVSASVE